MRSSRTTRKNTSDDYYGCLRVDVMRSCVLYRKIEGWVSAVTRVAARRISSQPEDRSRGRI